MTRTPFRARIGSSLAGKLILAIGLLFIVGGGTSWYILISAAKKNLMNGALEDAAAYSDLVRKSTRYSMLTFHRDAVQQIIEEVGARKEIEGLRIFDSRGKIFYSFHRGEIGSVADRKAEACAGCHDRGKEPSQILAHERRWLIHNRADNRILTYIEPLYNEPSCSASCHIHPARQRVLGILQTDFSLSSVDKTILRQTTHMTIYAFFFMTIMAVALYAVLRKLVLRPLSAVDAAMEDVAEGKLGKKVAIDSADEMGRLASTFNMMTGELAEARGKMENWTKSLEEGIAQKTEELKRSQDKLIQAEKLASLGRLTADVAHEIRNPLTALGGFARRLRKIAENDREREYADIVSAEADRLEKILKDVLTFSRDARSHFEKYPLERVVRTTVRLYEDLCREQSVLLEIHIGESLMPVLMDVDQVSQALGNLLSNALDAMPDGGRVAVTAGKEEMNDIPYMFLRVSDTGEGIPAKDLPLIFEPFFSTKNIGHGTGLGLSITRKIMEEHGGFIRAESRTGEGSSFTLYFPYQSEEESLQVKCWEYMKCGREKDSSVKCPAYPNFGRVCWAVAGTFCEGKVQGTFAQKYDDCKRCEFYQKMGREKGEKTSRG